MRIFCVNYSRNFCSKTLPWKKYIKERGNAHILCVIQQCQHRTFQVLLCYKRNAGGFWIPRPSHKEIPAVYHNSEERWTLQDKHSYLKEKDERTSLILVKTRKFEGRKRDRNIILHVKKNTVFGGRKRRENHPSCWKNTDLWRRISFFLLKNTKQIGREMILLSKENRNNKRRKIEKKKEDREGTEAEQSSFLLWKTQKT